jgi:hypothetical protein
MIQQLEVHTAVMPGVLPDHEIPEWRDRMVETALDNLREDGELDPTLLCVCRGGPEPDTPTLMSSIMLNEWMQTEELKDTLAELLPHLLHDLQCWAYVLLLDTNISIPDLGLNSEAMLVAAEHAGSDSTISYHRYDRDGSGKVTHVHPPAEGVVATMDGRFTNLLRTPQHAPPAEA